MCGSDPLSLPLLFFHMCFCFCLDALLVLARHPYFCTNYKIRGCCTTTRALAFKFCLLLFIFGFSERFILVWEFHFCSVFCAPHTQPRCDDFSLSCTHMQWVQTSYFPFVFCQQVIFTLTYAYTYHGTLAIYMSHYRITSRAVCFQVMLQKFFICELSR